MGYSTRGAVKPWERALARDPLCAFIEAVVDGYSPIDKHICKFARIAATMRGEPWWGDTSWCTDPSPRGSAVTHRRRPDGLYLGFKEGDALHGEITWV